MFETLLVVRSLYTSMDLLSSGYDMPEAKVPFTLFFLFLLHNGSDGFTRPMGFNILLSLFADHGRRHRSEAPRMRLHGMVV